MNAALLHKLVIIICVFVPSTSTWPLHLSFSMSTIVIAPTYSHSQLQVCPCHPHCWTFRRRHSNANAAATELNATPLLASLSNSQSQLFLGVPSFHLVCPEIEETLCLAQPSSFQGLLSLSLQSHSKYFATHRTWHMTIPGAPRVIAVSNSDNTDSPPQARTSSSFSQHFKDNCLDEFCIRRCPFGFFSHPSLQVSKCLN